MAPPASTCRPQARRVGYVFQGYALFPHLTVADNLGFGLRDRPRAERARRVAARRRAGRPRRPRAAPAARALGRPAPAGGAGARARHRARAAAARRAALGARHAAAPRAARRAARAAARVGHRGRGRHPRLHRGLPARRSHRRVRRRAAWCRRRRARSCCGSRPRSRWRGSWGFPTCCTAPSSRRRPTASSSAGAGQILEAVNSPTRSYLPPPEAPIAFFIRPEYVRLVRKDRGPADPHHHMNVMRGLVVADEDFGTTWLLRIRLDAPGPPAQGGVGPRGRGAPPRLRDPRDRPRPTLGVLDPPRLDPRAPGLSGVDDVREGCPTAWRLRPLTAGRVR